MGWYHIGTQIGTKHGESLPKGAVSEAAEEGPERAGKGFVWTGKE